MKSFFPQLFLSLLKQSTFNELCDYEFTGEVKIEESEDEEEIPTMVIDEDQDSVDEKTEEKKDDSKPLVSVELETTRKQKRLQYS